MVVWHIRQCLASFCPIKKVIRCYAYTVESTFHPPRRTVSTWGGCGQWKELLQKVPHILRQHIASNCLTQLRHKRHQEADVVDRYQRCSGLLLGDYRVQHCTCVM